MKHIFLFLFTLVFFSNANASEKRNIRIGTNNTDLILHVGENGRLYQSYYGQRLKHDADLDNLILYKNLSTDGRGCEVYSCNGNEDYYEPALSILHNDGNPSTYLYYVSSEQTEVPGGTKTVIRLKDDKYPVEVSLNYVAYKEEDVIKTWSVIRHAEKKP